MTGPYVYDVASVGSSWQSELIVHVNAGQLYTSDTVRPSS